jgi:hypothetical protein
VEFQKEVSVVVLDNFEIAGTQHDSILEKVNKLLQAEGLDNKDIGIWVKELGTINWCTICNKETMPSFRDRDKLFPINTMMAFNWDKPGSLLLLKETVLKRGTSFDDYIMYLGQYTGVWYTKLQKTIPGLVALDCDGFTLPSGLEFDNELLCARYYRLLGTRKLHGDFSILLDGNDGNITSDYVVM